MNHLEVKIEQFSNVLKRLRAMLELPEDNPAKKDAVVKNFEFTYEAAWKSLHSTLRELGIQANSPKDVFERAHKQRLIDHKDIWLQMKKDRNDTSHEYNEEKAAEIYSRIPSYAKEFGIVLENVRKIDG